MTKKEKETMDRLIAEFDEMFDSSDDVDVIDDGDFFNVDDED